VANDNTQTALAARIGCVPRLPDRRPVTPIVLQKGLIVEIDTDKIDDAVLAPLWLTLHDERRAWKGFDWDALARLHRKGLIDNPASKAKSLVLSDEGLTRAEMPSDLCSPVHSVMPPYPRANSRSLFLRTIAARDSIEYNVPRCLTL